MEERIFIELMTSDRKLEATLEDNPGANRNPISHLCKPILVAFVWELTKETINLPLGCFQGGVEEVTGPSSRGRGAQWSGHASGGQNSSARAPAVALRGAPVWRIYGK